MGVDVSKERLDLGVEREGEEWQAGNDAVGICATAARLVQLQPALVVELCARQVPVALVNPGRVREFAKSMGLLAKTDKLDAHLLPASAEPQNWSPRGCPLSKCSICRA